MSTVTPARFDPDAITAWIAIVAVPPVSTLEAAGCTLNAASALVSAPNPNDPKKDGADFGAVPPDPPDAPSLTNPEAVKGAGQPAVRGKAATDRKTHTASEDPMTPLPLTSSNW